MENIVSSTRHAVKMAVSESFVNANVFAEIVDPVTCFSLAEPQAVVLCCGFCHLVTLNTLGTLLLGSLLKLESEKRWNFKDSRSRTETVTKEGVFCTN